MNMHKTAAAGAARIWFRIFIESPFVERRGYGRE